mmetsp:Transcript_10994/g.12993  ORF Transcript_10994/g.12993 Transcript_10994/m.12993 type:complete len:353 (-) Transcript_10994:41-1099(-)
MKTKIGLWVIVGALTSFLLLQLLNLRFIAANTDEREDVPTLFNDHTQSHDDAAADDADINREEYGDALVIMTDHKYALWAIKFLDTLRQFNEVPTSIECILMGEIKRANRDELAKRCDSMMEQQHQDLDVYMPSQLRSYNSNITDVSVVWYKLLMLTHPYFRKFRTVRYIDVDHLVHSPIDWNLWLTVNTTTTTTTDKGHAKAAALLGKGEPCNLAGGRYREFKRIRKNLKLRQLLPLTDRDVNKECLSARMMVFQMDTEFFQSLYPPTRMLSHIENLLEQFPPRDEFRFKEQSFLQIVFWNQTFYLDGITFQTQMEHLYHQRCWMGRSNQCTPISTSSNTINSNRRLKMAT